MNQDSSSFSARLLAWQRLAGRHDLPWQNTRDPYRIWLSEIMLQQTQVATVIPYYQRFLDRFPEVRSLAAATPEQVSELWAGLGYYARARNLHRCAQVVVERHGGDFPRSAAALAELPGIGRSTAAAIAAFAWGERGAILDGNVKRVLCRHFGIDGFPGSKAVENRLWALAEELLPASGIEAYTQGLMDLGATLCTRGRPRCGDCPLAADCVARRDSRQSELPAARPRPPLPERSADYCFFHDGSTVLLERRPPVGLWGGLLVPPEGRPEELAARYGLRLLDSQPLPRLVHRFTHFCLHLQGHLCRVEPLPQAGEGNLLWLPTASAASRGVPTPVRKLLQVAFGKQKPA